MAANEYYHSPYTTAYHDQTPPYSYSSRKNDALPPPPSHSPFHDQAYPYGNPSASHSYTGSHGRLNNDSDPFEDDDAVPMHGRRPKHDSAATVAPILPHEVEDPFVRDVDPGRPKGRRTRDGWFKGKVPWVVYTLTVIQLVVFIAEIARNGMLKYPFKERSAILTERSRPHKITNRNPPILQRHDRPIAVCHDQHGREISAVHAQHGQRAKLVNRDIMALSQRHLDNGSQRQLYALRIVRRVRCAQPSRRWQH